RRRGRRARNDGAGGRARARQAARRDRGRPGTDRTAAGLVTLVRVLALDYGSARCGCALSDPTGTLATPIEPVLRPATRKGLARVADLVRERDAGLVVVGLPL